jgi:hypothetical protein
MPSTGKTGAVGAGRALLVPANGTFCSTIKGANSSRTKIVHAQWGFRGHDTAICIMRFEEGESKPNVELMPKNRDCTATVTNARIFLASLPPHRRQTLV